MEQDKILKKIADLEKEVLDARKLAEYHDRCLMDPNISERWYKKHLEKRDYLRVRQRNKEREVEELRDQLKKLEFETIRQTHHKDLSNFYNSMIEGFLNLQTGVKDLLAGKHADLISSTEYIGSVYQEQSGRFKHEDLQMFRDYPILGLKVQVGRILEEEKEAFRISVTRGALLAAQKRANIET